MDSVIAVDLGGTNVRVARVLRDGTIVSFQQTGVSGITEGTEIAATIADLIETVMVDSSPLAIGVSTAGPVDIRTGSVVHSPNMQAESISLVSPLLDRFQIPVHMLTDCKAGALGEHVFGCREDNLVYITVSTGIGGGVLQNGRILMGADGNAGEIGHLIVDTSYNLQCGCGGVGHWEAFCSGSGIPRFFELWCKTRKIDITPMTVAEILNRADAGDEPYVSFARELSRLNTCGLQAVICAYNPSVIVLDGPIALQHPSLFAGDVGIYLSKPKILFSKLQGRAPLLGAAAYAFQFSTLSPSAGL